MVSVCARNRYGNARNNVDVRARAAAGGGTIVRVGRSATALFDGREGVHVHACIGIGDGVGADGDAGGNTNDTVWQHC